MDTIVSAEIRKSGTSELSTAHVAIGAAGIIWGVNYTLAKITVTEIDPLAVVLIRGVTTCLILVFFCRGFLTREFSAGKTLKTFLYLSFLGIFANQILFTTGLRRTTPSHSALIMALIPIFVLLISVTRRKESLTLFRTFGIFLSFAGIYLISLSRGFAFDLRYLTGDLITMAGAFCFSLFTVYGKDTVARFGAVRTIAVCYLFGTALFVPVCAVPAWNMDYAAVSWKAWACLGYTILGATLIAYLLWSWALEKLLASRVAAFTYVQPLIAMVSSYFILREALPPDFYLGAAMVFSGLFLAQRS
jgi:drug/metabolite transporter (DMT)-like permease